MKNKTAPPGFTRFFRFAGLLPIGAGFAKRNDGPQCPPQAKKIWDLGCVLYKKHKPPRGVSARRRRKIFGHLGALYTKITLLGCIQERVSGAKHPPNLKISASGGPNPQMFENNPPLVAKSGITRGGFFSRGGFFRRYRLMCPTHYQFLQSHD